MRVSQFWKKLLLFHNLIIKPPKRWRLPQKSDVLIYDGCGLEALMPYLNGYSYYVHYTRGEAVNVPCLLMSLLDISFLRGKILAAYGRQVIKMVAPKVVLTFIDNNVQFYRITLDFQGLSTVFVQNGLRGGSTSIFKDLNRGEKYRVDYMLVFNRPIAAKFGDYIEGETLIAGSLKNNHCKGFGMETGHSGTILFISQYREKSIWEAGVKAQGRYYWEDFYNLDLLLVQWLGEWCLGHGRKLLVCGCSPKEYKAGEVSWYESILSGCKCSWEYLQKDSICDSYRAVQKADIVVGIDSALVYEAFGRGKKTAFLTGREEVARNFAWPAELPESGPFWSNNPDKSEFLRIMDYLSNISEGEWTLVHKQYQDDVMAYDPGNVILQQLIEKLLSKSSVAFQEKMVRQELNSS